MRTWGMFGEGGEGGLEYSYLHQQPPQCFMLGIEHK